MSARRMQGAARELQGEQLLKGLREALLDCCDFGVDDSAQIQALGAALRGVADEKRRGKARRGKARRVWLAVGAPLVAAAAAAATVVGYPELFSGAPAVEVAEQSSPQQPNGEVGVAVEGAPVDAVILTEGRRKVLQPGHLLAVGDEVSTRKGELALRFSSGARAQLASGSRARVEGGAAQRKEGLFLAGGEVEVEVPPLGDRKTFAVSTPGALVVVHGTRFRVEVDPNAAADETKVSVSRGVVSVHVEGEPEVRLTAGESWPDAKPEVDLLAPEGFDDDSIGEGQEDRLERLRRRAEMRRRAQREESRRKGSRRRARRKVSKALGLENGLFEEAMIDKRVGDDAGTARTLERFLRTYPRSVLAQEARVEHFRALHRLARGAAAASSARRYLREYPQGYAREEARRLVLGD